MLIQARSRWLQASSLTAVLLTILAWTYGGLLGHETEKKEYANASLLISGEELRHHLNDPKTLIVDARHSQQYTAGHIPGAVNLPIAEITQVINGVPGMLAPIKKVEMALGQRGIARQINVVVYDDLGGVPATRLFWVLDYIGHPKVSILQGGFQLWQKERRPIQRQIPDTMAVEYEATPLANRLANKEWVRTRLKDPTVVLVDARSTQEFDGLVPEIEIKRAGHIPGSVNVDWNRNLTGEPRQFKPAAKLARIYRKAGATPEKEIVIYCRTGARASHDYFVLRLLGYPRVRLYDGSYVEWSADETLPTAR